MKIIITTNANTDVILSDGMVNIIGYARLEVVPETSKVVPAAPEKPGKTEKPEKAAKKERGTYAKKEYDVPKMIALRNAGWTYEKIADEMGCPRSTVYRLIEQYMDEHPDGKAEEGLPS